MNTERPLLRVDMEYRNTNNWKHRDDVFNKMFRGFPDRKGIQNVGGFRIKSKINGTDTGKAFCVLVTNFGESEWPDHLELETGAFTYFGDNRRPGHSLHETSSKGNLLLRYAFELMHRGDRSSIPPFLCFESIKRSTGTFMRFLGLAAPGASNLTSLEDLVAVWRVHDSSRFQNYRSKFTILKEETIQWEWLDDLVRNEDPVESPYCPPSWEKWVSTGRYEALQCAKTKTPRSRDSQLPLSESNEGAYLDALLELSNRQFEFAAKEILSILDKRFVNLEMTPFKKDGGRDVIGIYLVGDSPNELQLTVHAEAKRWQPRSGIGVRQISRLLSRVRHRDLGVFVTTSYFNRQVQEEIIEDSQPVLLISGGDIVRLLISRDMAGPDYEKIFYAWLYNIRTEANE